VFKKFSEEQLDRAKKLVRSANVYAVSIFTPMLDKFTEMRSIANSGLMEFWDYLVTVASVGTAFMAIMDKLPEKDHAGMPYAVQEAINQWKSKSYDVMIDFLNYFNKLTDSGVEAPNAIGGWIWVNLEKDPKSNNDLKNLAASLKLVPVTGLGILKTFFKRWSEK